MSEIRQEFDEKSLEWFVWWKRKVNGWYNLLVYRVYLRQVWGTFAADGTWIDRIRGRKAASLRSVTFNRITKIW